MFRHTGCEARIEPAAAQGFHPHLLLEGAHPEGARANGHQ
jgi:hypothetical protein